MSDPLDALIDEHLSAPASDPLDALINEHLTQKQAPLKFAQPGETSKDVAGREIRVGDIGGAGTLGAHFVRHTPYGLGDKLMAGINALEDKWHDKTGKVTLADAYKRDLAFNDKAIDASDEWHPVERWAGNGLGIAASMLVPAGALRVLRGAPTAVAAAPAAGRTLMQLIKAGAAQGAKTGSGMGALGGYGNSRADGLGDTAADTLEGAGLGLLGGTVLGGLVPVGQAGAKLLYKGVADTASQARHLLGKGVNLTIGQRAPNSFLNKLEESATSAPVAGHALSDSRRAAMEQWGDAALNEGRAPGAPPVPTHGELADKLSAVHGGFEPAYDAISKTPVRPVGPGGQPLADVFESIVKDPSVYADDASRGTAGAWLKNQATSLDGNRASNTAQDLMSLRSNLRSELRDALAAEDKPKVAFLKRAAKNVTYSLEEQLPADSRKTLQDIDGAYSRYKVLEDAVAKTKDQSSGLTPSKLSDAVRRGVADKGTYARGGGGELRELANSGKAVFDSVSPMTGHRAQTYPFHTDIPAAMAFNYINRSPRLQSALLGELPVQQFMSRAVDVANSELERQRWLVDALRRTPGTLAADSTQLRKGRK
jgi:hypothetical protein